MENKNKEETPTAAENVETTTEEIIEISDDDSSIISDTTERLSQFSNEDLIIDYFQMFLGSCYIL